MSDLSVIILSYNTCDLLQRCLSHLRTAAADREIEILVVDNGSTDGSREYLTTIADSAHVILNDHNAGFAGGNNQGLEIASGDVILLLNSDAFVNKQAIDQALELFARNPRAGIVGLRIDNPDGSLQAGSGSFPTFWDDLVTSAGIDQIRRQRDDRDSPRLVDWVHGACIFIRREAYRQIGGLDTGFFMYSEEVEWCYRCWQHGWEVWYLPDVGVTHLGGGSSREHDLDRRAALYASRLRFRRLVSGAAASAMLWTLVLAALSARIVARSVVQAVIHRDIGRQTPKSDWQLLRTLFRVNPLRDAAH